MRPLFGPGRLLPGFRLSLGCAVLYLSLIVLLPLSGLVFKASQLSLDAFWDIASGERALASYRVTFGASLLAASINAVFGLIVAWVLVRYSFPGKRVIDALLRAEETRIAPGFVPNRRAIRPLVRFSASGDNWKLEFERSGLHSGAVHYDRATDTLVLSGLPDYLKRMLDEAPED